MKTSLQLRVENVETMVLTGIYSEETHLPQLLRISVHADLDVVERFAPGTSMAASKNYLDLKNAILDSCPEEVHFTLVEAVADAIIDRVMDSDERVTRVDVKIIKAAISKDGESIGIRRVRER